MCYCLHCSFVTIASYLSWWILICFLYLQLQVSIKHSILSQYFCHYKNRKQCNYMDSKSWRAYTTTTFRITTYCVKGSQILYKTNWHYQHKHKKPTSKTMAKSTKPKDHCKETRKLAVLLRSLTSRVHNQNVSSSSPYGSHPCEVA